jgi:hypothetical protein
VPRSYRRAQNDAPQVQAQWGLGSPAPRRPPDPTTTTKSWREPDRARAISPLARGAPNIRQLSTGPGTAHRKCHSNSSPAYADSLPLSRRTIRIAWRRCRSVLLADGGDSDLSAATLVALDAENIELAPRKMMVALAWHYRNTLCTLPLGTHTIN